MEKNQNKSLLLKIGAVDEFMKIKIFRQLVNDEEKTAFARIAKKIEEEIFYEKEIKNIYRPLEIIRPRNAFIREPIFFTVGDIKEINNLKCCLTGQNIPIGDECLLLIIKTESQGYIISGAIKYKEDFNELLKQGTIKNFKMPKNKKFT